MLTIHRHPSHHPPRPRITYPLPRRQISEHTPYHPSRPRLLHHQKRALPPRRHHLQQNKQSRYQGPWSRSLRDPLWRQSSLHHPLLNLEIHHQQQRHPRQIHRPRKDRPPPQSYQDKRTNRHDGRPRRLQASRPNRRHRFPRLGRPAHPLELQSRSLTQPATIQRIHGSDQSHLAKDRGRADAQTARASLQLHERLRHDPLHGSHERAAIQRPLRQLKRWRRLLRAARSWESFFRSSFLPINALAFSTLLQPLQRLERPELEFSRHNTGSYSSSLRGPQTLPEHIRNHFSQCLGRYATHATCYPTSTIDTSIKPLG